MRKSQYGMKKIKHTFTLDKDVLDALKIASGRTPVSTYVNDVLWYLYVATDEQRREIDRIETREEVTA